MASPWLTLPLIRSPSRARVTACRRASSCSSGWRWLEQAIRAEQGLARSNNAEEQDFYRGKLQAARYFLTWEVPSCHHDLSILEARDDTCLGMQDAWF